jgi:hypothetical protein
LKGDVREYNGQPESYREYREVHGTSSCGLSVGGEKNKLPACVHLAINCVATNIQNDWY